MQIYACWVCILLTEIWKIKTNNPPLIYFISTVMIKLHCKPNFIFQWQSVSICGVCIFIWSSGEKKNYSWKHWVDVCDSSIVFHRERRTKTRHWRKVLVIWKSWGIFNANQDPSMLFFSTLKFKNSLSIDSSLHHLIYTIHTENEALCQWEFY